MADGVLNDDRSVLAVASSYDCTWNTCHTAVAATADAALDSEPAPVAVLGMDETGRGQGHSETDRATVKRVWIDRVDTGLADIASNAGLLVQINGRSAGPVVDWRAERDPASRATIDHSPN